MKVYGTLEPLQEEKRTTRSKLLIVVGVLACVALLGYGVGRVQLASSVDTNRGRTSTTPVDKDVQRAFQNVCDRRMEAKPKSVIKVAGKKVVIPATPQPLRFSVAGLKSINKNVGNKPQYRLVPMVSYGATDDWINDWNMFKTMMPDSSPAVGFGVYNFPVWENPAMKEKYMLYSTFVTYQKAEKPYPDLAAKYLGGSFLGSALLAASGSLQSEVPRPSWIQGRGGKCSTWETDKTMYKCANAPTCCAGHKAAGLVDGVVQCIPAAWLKGKHDYKKICNGPSGPVKGQKRPCTVTAIAIDQTTTFQDACVKVILNTPDNKKTKEQARLMCAAVKVDSCPFGKSKSSPCCADKTKCNKPCELVTSWMGTEPYPKKCCKQIKEWCKSPREGCSSRFQKAIYQRNCDKSYGTANFQKVLLLEGITGEKTQCKEACQNPCTTFASRRATYKKCAGCATTLKKHLYGKKRFIAKCFPKAAGFMNLRCCGMSKKCGAARGPLKCNVATTKAEQAKGDQCEWTTHSKCAAKLGKIRAAIAAKKAKAAAAAKAKAAAAAKAKEEAAAKAAEAKKKKKAPAKKKAKKAKK